MSLQAKIEAVIYAAEEPVTLGQLVGLFGMEAQAELDRKALEQGELPLESLDLSSEVASESTAEASTEREIQSEGREPEPESAEPEAESAGSPESAEIAAGAESAPTSIDEKRLSREERARDRELRAYFRAVLDRMMGEYSGSDRGIEIREVAGGFRLATKPEYHDAVRGFVRSSKPPLKLSLQALETLAVVAYKQPITAPEISEIRGVDSGGVLGSLMTRKLITTAGRKHVIGRPILYKTTKDFLLRFGLKDTSELPGIEEFEKMANELAEPELLGSEAVAADFEAVAADEEDPMGAEGPHTDPELAQAMRNAESITGANLQEERESTEAQADGAGARADEVMVDGRISGAPPNLDRPSTGSVEDSPALDAEIQSDLRKDA